MPDESPRDAPVGGPASGAPSGQQPADGAKPAVRIMPKRNGVAAAAGAANPAANPTGPGNGMAGGGLGDEGMPNGGGRVTSVVARPIEVEMRQAFLDYAMS